MEICLNIFFKPKTSKVLSAASPKLRHVWALSFTKRVHPSLQASMGCSVSRAVDDNSPSSRIFRLLSSSRWLRNFRGCGCRRCGRRCLFRRCGRSGRGLRRRLGCRYMCRRDRCGSRRSAILGIIQLLIFGHLSREAEAKLSHQIPAPRLLHRHRKQAQCFHNLGDFVIIARCLRS